MKMIKKGFTLVELLVVIGVLAVLMAGVVTLIDPVDKNRAAQDAKVTSDVGQIASAMQTYAATNDGDYPADITDLIASGDLKSEPAQPVGGDYDLGGAADNIWVCGDLQSKKYTDGGFDFWCWCSQDGTAGAAAAQGCP